MQRGALRSAGRHQPVVSSRMDPGAGPCPVSLQSPRRAGGCGIPFIGARHAQWVGRGELPQSPPAPPGAWRWRVAREKMSVPPSPGRKPPGPARAGHRELWGSSLVPLCGRGRRARHSQHLIGCQRFLAWCDGWEGGCHRNIESCIHASRGFIGTLCGGEMVVNTSLGFIHTSDVIIVTPVLGPVVAFV